jgi:hypothetical protein
VKSPFSLEADQKPEHRSGSMVQVHQISSLTLFSQEQKRAGVVLVVAAQPGWS